MHEPRVQATRASMERESRAVGFKDKMKDAAAQAAAQARKAAEQAKDIAAEVKDQASDKWAEEQQRRAAQDASAPTPGASGANPDAASETSAPIAGSPEGGPAPDPSRASWPPPPPPPPPPTAAPGLREKVTDAAARATVQARKSVEDAKDRGSQLKGQLREQAPTRQKSPDLLRNARRTGSPGTGRHRRYYGWRPRRRRRQGRARFLFVGFSIWFREPQYRAHAHAVIEWHSYQGHGEARRRHDCRRAPRQVEQRAD